MMPAIESVYVVNVEGRIDGLYLFRDAEDSKAFHRAVVETGGDATLSEEFICDASSTTALIEQERSA